MRLSDKEYYRRRKIEDNRKRRSLAKAANRGKVAKEWFDKGNRLTTSTKPEFDRLMKKADMEWEEANEPK